jgi:hypothetical protein
MDGKIQQCVCIKFCVKLGKSTTETLKMLREACREHSLSWTVVFDQAPAKQQKMLKKFENSSKKTIAKLSMSSQTPLGSIMEFAGRS